MTNTINILTTTDYFLPGFNGGGPVRTLDNMRRQLSGEVTLSIFTRDRDLGADCPYPGVERNQWVETPEGPVFYACPQTFGPQGVRLALAARPVDALYLNSFFSPRSSILLYLAIRRLTPRLPILLAPRGEFSAGAMAIKRTKKQAFLSTARMLGLYRDVFWHASTGLEARDILRQFPRAEGRIHIAPDPVIANVPAEAENRAAKRAGHLRIVFISRISPKKNLDGLLKILGRVRAPVELDIFGPVEDEAYWCQCERKIASLADNIRVTSYGPIVPDAVSPTFARYDLFAFPTRGENFGHVIFEALRAGTPILLSDQTPWRPDASGALTALPLGDEDGWCHAIEQAATRTQGEQSRLRAAAFDYASRYATTDGSARANREMFYALLS